MNREINRQQINVGLTAILLGILFYGFFRTAEHTYFIQFFGIAPQLKIKSSHLLLNITNSLPTFIHVFAFSILTAGIMATSKKGYAATCLLWFGINVLFELGQKFDYWVIQLIPDWFSDIPFLENTKAYFLKGRFDYVDLFSIMLGAFVAYIFLIITSQKRRENEKKTINYG